MRTSLALFAMAAIAAVGLSSTASAQEPVVVRVAPASPAAPIAATTTAPATDPAREADVKNLAELITTFEKAYNAADAHTLADMFTKDAEISDDEGSTLGRESIEKRFASWFAENPKTTIDIQVDSLRFLSADVAVETGRAVMTVGQPEPKTITNKYSVVYLKENGRWLQSKLHDDPADEPTVPERLKELEWLVGEWVNESSEAVVLTHCRWSDDKHYLLRDFTVQVAGKPALKGVQRIGWDPSLKQVRSWVFDSTGGFSEGYWTRQGEQWMIKAHGVHHDGKSVSSTQTISRVSPTQLRWVSTDRTRGGEAIPGADEYMLVRRPPAPSPPLGTR